MEMNTTEQNAYTFSFCTDWMSAATRKNKQKRSVTLMVSAPFFMSCYFISTTVTVITLLSSFAEISPSCSSTIFFAIASPRPALSVSVLE